MNNEAHLNFLEEGNDMRAKSKLKQFTIKSILPDIEGPKPKRNPGIKEFQNSKSKIKSSNTQKFMVGGMINRNTKVMSYHQKKQKNKKVPYNFCDNITDAQEKENQSMIQIFSYFAGEYNAEKAGWGKNEIFLDWELSELAINYDDTNLGDFTVKLPNPDSMPKDLIKNQKQQTEIEQISFTDAFERFDEMFNTEQNIDKNNDQYEKKCFIIMFYLLVIDKSIKNKSSKEYREEEITNFIKLYNYFRRISDFSYIDYLNIQKDQEFKKQQYQFENHIQEYQKKLSKKTNQNNVTIQQIQNEFYHYKYSIYQSLQKNFSDKNNKIQIMGNVRLVNIFKKVHSLSALLKMFPSLFQQLQKQSFKAVKKDYNQLKRKLYGGNYLKKISKDGELRWVRSGKRPQDLLTLLRNILIYKLSRRGGLFIRSFLSQDQSFIFLIVKASEKHLEQMAQKTNFNMEVELGSIDIFSFEPVDKYNRPLRTNKYLRENSFISKYNLHSNKNDKDQDTGQVSVESQSIALYKKAKSMNEEELRAKIILDQEEADSQYTWLSHVTGVKFIHHNEVLNNKYNTDEIDEKVWPVYYIYIKMIIEGIKRFREELQGTKKGDPKTYEIMMGNLGLILRLMFQRALFVGNKLYQQHRDDFFRTIKNYMFDTKILKTIWDIEGETEPRTYWKYFSSKKYERLWRKYQISQQKNRSKFTPATRITITNRIIREYINISKSISSFHILDFFPIHDPYILKNIFIRPYLNVISAQLQSVKENKKIQEELSSNKIWERLTPYECEYTKQDFTKQSVIEKLSFQCKYLTDFSVNTICFYCGQKLAFYFEFRRFLAKRTIPFIIVTLILQIIYWVELYDIQTVGSSNLNDFVNVLMLIMTFINVFWVDRTINKWVNREKVLAKSFGTSSDSNSIAQQSNYSQKRVLYVGETKRNMETDEMNDEQAGVFSQFLKKSISLFISIIFIICMGASILLIFALKTEMFQRGLPLQIVSMVPTILISLIIQVFNFIYGHMVKFLVDFENKKTVPEYEASISTKSFIVTFVITFYALFIYSFFSGVFTTADVCKLKTSEGAEIQNCYYFLSNQILTSSIVDFIVTIVMAALPFVMFKINMYLSNSGTNRDVAFNINYFESIDKFYEEQGQMQSYMFTDEVDNTWKDYTTVVISFCMLILFGPVLPFLYFMIFITGIVSLHSKKHEIIYLSKRSLPVKVKSIGSWVLMLKIVSVMGVFTNMAFVVYVRGLFTENISNNYFAIVFVLLLLKHGISMMTQPKQDITSKRGRIKTNQLIHQKVFAHFKTNNEIINTDIQNLYYDEDKLNRKLPKLKGANIKLN